MAQRDNGRQLVLVVDDNAHIRSAIRDILKTIEVDIVHARNGREGVSQFGARRAEIDAVVLDIHMPMMNGERVLSEIRKVNPDIPVLISSSYDRSDMINEQIELGQVHYLRKPYTFRSFLSIMQEMLSSSEVVAPLA